MSAPLAMLRAMVNLPTTVPEQITAGDTVRWRRSVSDYPASAGWALRYFLVSPTEQITVESTGEGAVHVVDVAASVTAQWDPGLYRVVECAVRSAERFTLSDSGTLRIQPNLAAATAGLDTRSHARKTLDAIEAWIERKAGWAAEVSIEGSTLKQMPVGELLTLRDRYRGEVRREEQVADVANGKRPGHRVLVRF